MKTMKCNAFKCGCEGKAGWHEEKYNRQMRADRNAFEADLETALDEVRDEVLRAYAAFPVDFRSAHEGVAIIEEEFIEFRDAAYWPHKEETGDEDVEVLQLAAMSVRYLIDVCYREDTPR
jgi:hypothetical protein